VKKNTLIKENRNNMKHWQEIEMKNMLKRPLLGKQRFESARDRKASLDDDRRKEVKR